MLFKRDFLIVILLFLTASTIYSLLSLTRHFHFQSQGIDFAIYDQALWLYSKFESPFSTINFRHDLADRFRPIMIPLSLLYVFTNNESTLLIFQAVIVSATVFPIWLIARKRLVFPFSVLPSFLYISFMGVQSLFFDDFHEASLLPFLLAWLFYFLHRKLWKSYFVTLLLCLSVREHLGFFFSILTSYIYLSSKNIKLALSTFIISLSWSIIAITVVMPAIGKADYSSFVQTGDNLYSAVVSYLTNPLSIIVNFFYPIEKIRTIFFSFVSFGFLPLLQLNLLPVIIFQFAYRFLDIQHPIRSTIFYHYSLELAVLMTISTIFVLEKLKIIFKSRNVFFYIMILVLFIINVAVNKYLHAPVLTLLKSNFYVHETWMEDNRIILSKISEDQSVSAQNNLAPHLSHRKEIYVFPTLKSANYLVLDLHPGQDDWNFYSENLQKTRNLMKQLITSNDYRIIYSSGYSFLLEKIE